MQIAGAVAVVTGAASGIGHSVAVDLARRGATVVAVDRRPAELDATVDGCRRHAPGSFGHVADLSTREACDSAVAAVAERLGRVDILVNNAAISMRKPAVDTTLEDVERIMAVNYFAPVALTMTALPGMLDRRRGSIVNVTSVAGYVPNPKESAYSASKAALSLWSHVLAVELRGTGVHVGVVSPGLIDTEIWTTEEFAGASTGKLWPPEVVAAAVARSIERERVHVTVPRRFGIPPVLYSLFGRPMRWGLRRFDEKISARRRTP